MNQENIIQENFKMEKVKQNEPVIEITNLMKSFNGIEVLKDTSLKLYEGENLVVLGKSGTGKSVLIKCIIGLLQPDKGSIKVFGNDVGRMNKRDFNLLRQKIGFLFQSGALYDSMTIKENLEFPLLRIKKDIKKSEVEERIKSVLDSIGLPDVLNKMPSELSGGMRKRVSLARTIIVDPEILLYDEPTTGLDPVTSDEISELINEVQTKYHTSSIIITHDLRCALKTGNRMLMLDEGIVRNEGSLKEFQNSDDPLIRSFFKENIN
ncbi:MAG TPA: ATP-binding cassette domain-containing protein [Lentimicrobium sp.]|nr:ATP-binding cassette domain-containing protein [Lentimicrobium sp.]